MLNDKLSKKKSKINLKIVNDQSKKDLDFFNVY
jgi:hypothetical protein